jgi:hypothetical protein
VTKEKSIRDENLLCSSILNSPLKRLLRYIYKYTYSLYFKQIKSQLYRRIVYRLHGVISMKPAGMESYACDSFDFLRFSNRLTNPLPGEKRKANPNNMAAEPTMQPDIEASKMVAE